MAIGHIVVSGSSGLHLRQRLAQCGQRGLAVGRPRQGGAV